jgi:hypothetical protein
MFLVWIFLVFFTHTSIPNSIIVGWEMMWACMRWQCMTPPPLWSHWLISYISNIWSYKYESRVRICILLDCSTQLYSDAILYTYLSCQVQLVSLFAFWMYLERGSIKHDLGSTCVTYYNVTQVQLPWQQMWSNSRDTVDRRTGKEWQARWLYIQQAESP